MTPSQFHSMCVAQPDGCVIWNPDEQKHAFDYGSVCIPGVAHSTAHRVAWVIAYGPIPDGMNVLHNCDRPRCVNLKHLRLGTQADNMHDRDAKHRCPEDWRTPKQDREYGKGDKTPLAKLKSEDVLSIRQRASAGEMFRTIAEDYKVHWLTISRIVRRLTWRNLPS